MKKLINRNGWWLMLVTAVAGLSTFFLILVDNYLDGDGLIKWDTLINQWVETVRTPLMNKIVELITLTANWQIIFWGLVLGIILLGLAKKWRYAWAMLISVSTGILFTELTKMFIARPRPPVENAIIVEKGMAFPSAHSYFAIVFYGLITYFWVKHFRSKWMKIMVGILGAGLCLLIGVSRIYLGVHWTTDVLAGFASSLAWLFLTILYLEYKNKYFASEYKDFNRKLVWRGFWLFTLLWLVGVGVLFLGQK